MLGLLLGLALLTGFIVLVRELVDRKKAKSIDASKIAKAQPKKKKAAWKGAFPAFELTFDRALKNPLIIAIYTLCVLLQSLIFPPDVVARDGMFYLGFVDFTYFIFLLAIPLYCLALADNKKVSLGSLFRINFKKYFSILAAEILSILILVISFVLLIVPLIWTLPWIFFAGLIVADKGMGPIAAIKESKRLVRDNKGKAWGIVGVSVLLGIAAGIVMSLPYGMHFGVVLFSLSAIWSTAASAVLYRWLQKNNEVAETENA
jgi:hypothetical protein